MLIGSHGAFGAHHFDGRQGSDFHLLLVIGERLVRQGQRVLLHFDVLVSIHQVPVHVLDLIDGGDHLQAERDVGNLAVVFRDANEPRVRQKSQSLQQGLAESGTEIGIQRRAQGGERLVGGDARVVETDREL